MDATNPGCSHIQLLHAVFGKEALHGCLIEQVEFIAPGPFHFSTSLLMLLAVIVGGSGRFFGPVVGTIVIILLPEVLRSSSIESLKFMQKWYLVFFGLAVVALMIWLPGGILSIADRFRKREAPR